MLIEETLGRQIELVIVYIYAYASYIMSCPG